jgi:hypothetical protein
MDAVPGATAATANVAVEEPAATVTAAGTVATAVLLLASDRFAPPAGAAADRVTVACALPPAARVATLSETDDMPVVEVGADVDPPHCAAARRPTTAATSEMNRVECLLMCFMRR